MRLAKLTLLVALISSCLVAPIVVADIIVSNFSSSNSIAISSNDFETEKEYFLEISIEGIDSRNVSIQPHGQMLILEITQGATQGSARANSQKIIYTYSFADDADMHKLFRLNSKNGIRIAIPKR